MVRWVLVKERTGCLAPVLLSYVVSVAERLGAMPTLAVGMSETREDRRMPTASVGMAPVPRTFRNRNYVSNAPTRDAGGSFVFIIHR